MLPVGVIFLSFIHCRIRSRNVGGDAPAPLPVGLRPISSAPIHGAASSCPVLSDATTSKDSPVRPDAFGIRAFISADMVVRNCVIISLSVAILFVLTILHHQSNEIGRAHV